MILDGHQLPVVLRSKTLQLEHYANDYLEDSGAQTDELRAAVSGQLRRCYACEIGSKVRFLCENVTLYVAHCREQIAKSTLFRFGFGQNQRGQELYGPTRLFDDLRFNVTRILWCLFPLLVTHRDVSKMVHCKRRGVEEKEWDLDTSIKNKKYQHMC